MSTTTANTDQVILETVKNFFGDMPASFLINGQNELVRDYLTNPVNQGIDIDKMGDTILSSNVVCEFLVKLQEQISK